MRQIQVVNQAATVKGDDFGQALAAVQQQIDQDFAPIWVGAKLNEAHAMPGDPHDVQGETIFVLDNADQAGALGYHELSNAAVPVGFVFANTARTVGEDWSITLSHETLEQLADPWADYLARVPDAAGNYVGVALEVCDACEGESYLKLGRPVSDFVFPSYFRRGPNHGQLDFLSRIHSPLQILPGGYLPVTPDLKTWQQVLGARVPTRKALPHHLSRPGRRMARGMRQGAVYSMAI